MVRAGAFFQAHFFHANDADSRLAGALVRAQSTPQRPALPRQLRALAGQLGKLAHKSIIVAHELSGEIIRGMGIDLFRRAFLLHLSTVQQQRAIGDR